MKRSTLKSTRLPWAATIVAAAGMVAGCSETTERGGPSAGDGPLSPQPDVLAAFDLAAAAADSGVALADNSVPGVCSALKGEGLKPGQVAENWTLPDGDGSNVSLHDFCGKVVFFEASSEW